MHWFEVRYISNKPNLSVDPSTGSNTKLDSIQKKSYEISIEDEASMRVYDFKNIFENSELILLRNLYQN